MSYKVYVDDNYRYLDESARYELGEYLSLAAALEACKLIIDRFLTDSFQEGMSAEELYEQYRSFGEDPFVVPSPEGNAFSSWAYARQRCVELCGG